MLLVSLPLSVPQRLSKAALITSGGAGGSGGGGGGGAGDDGTPKQLSTESLGSSRLSPWAKQGNETETALAFVFGQSNVEPGHGEVALLNSKQKEKIASMGKRVEVCGVFGKKCFTQTKHGPKFVGTPYYMAKEGTEHMEADQCYALEDYIAFFPNGCFGAEVPLAYWLAEKYPSRRVRVVKKGKPGTAMGSSIGGFGAGAWGPGGSMHYQAKQSVDDYWLPGIKATEVGVFFIHGEGDTFDDDPAAAPPGGVGSGEEAVNERLDVKGDHNITRGENSTTTDDQRSRAIANASAMASLNDKDSFAYAPRLRSLINAARTWIADAACAAGGCLEDVERVRFSFVPPFNGTSTTCHPTEKAKDNLKTLVGRVKLDGRHWPNFNFVEISEDPAANNHVTRFCDWSDEKKDAEGSHFVAGMGHFDTHGLFQLGKMLLSGISPDNSSLVVQLK